MKFLLLLWSALLIAFPLFADTASPVTPREVWQDFDPRAEPLEMEILKHWTTNSANYTEFYFNGMTNGMEKVRVYGIYSAPIGGKHLPGILHIHGGGQTVNLQWLKFWNERGYAALTFNWGGLWTNRPKVTLWGSLTQGNHADARKKIEATDPSVRDSSWYLWTRVSRRALTVLEQQPEVDAKRLGIFGVSMGGTVTWPFAAMDKRVKAACAIYGVGWLTFPDELDAPDPRAADGSTKLWRKTMASEAYAPLVTCPILYLDATDDFYGKMDWAFRTLDSVAAKCRWSFTPRYNHHIAAEQGHNLPLWMDTWLKKSHLDWPEPPKAILSLARDGVPQVTIKPDDARTVERVEIFYAIENRNPKNRFWRSGNVEQSGKAWTASLPILDVNDPLFAFANVHYHSGVCLSSSLATKIPAKLGAAKATDKTSLLIDDFSSGTGDWITQSPATDPIPPVPDSITNRAGPNGKQGISVTRSTPLLTHKMGDPKWRGPDGARLQFQVYTPTPRELKVAVSENAMAPDAMKYSAARKIPASAEWQPVDFAAEDFKSDNGQPLLHWRKVKMLEIISPDSPASPPIYTDFAWRL